MKCNCIYRVHVYVIPYCFGLWVKGSCKYWGVVAVLTPILKIVFESYILSIASMSAPRVIYTNDQ